MRTIIIYGPKEATIEINNVLDSYKNELSKRNVTIVYKNSSTGFRAELYGYDKQLKMTIDNPQGIPKLLDAIDKMPMGALEKKQRETYSNLQNPLDVTSEEAFYVRYGKK